MFAIDNFKEISDTGRDAVRHFVSTSMESQEKIIRLNIDAIQDFVRVGSEQLKSGYSEISLADPINSWPQVMVGNIQRSTALNLGLIEISKRIQQELACVVEEHLRALRDGTLDAMDSCTGAAKAAVRSSGRQRSGADQLKHAA